MDNINWTEFIPFSQAIGWTIINSLWQIAIVTMCWRMLLGQIPPKRSNLRYSFTLLALILSTMWVGLTFSKEWSSNSLLPIDNQELITSIGVTPFSSNQAAGPGFSTIEPLPNTNSKGSYPTVKKGSGMSALSKYDWYQQAILQGQKFYPFIPYLAMLWFLGVWGLSFLIFGSFFQLNRLKTVGVSMPSPDWLQRFDLLKKQMGIAKKVQLLCSKKIATPLTFYFFKPVVLAPLGLFTGLPPAQVEVLLLHELAHIRRHDFLVNIFQSLIEILFFYHPAVWWMSGELRKEREHCCDDLVISIRNNPLLYAEALTCLQSPNFSLKTSLAMAATGKNGSFSQRIFRLFGQYNQQPITLKGTVLLLVLLLTGFLTQGFYKSTEPILTPNISEIIDISQNPESTKLPLPKAAEEVINDNNIAINTPTTLEKFDTKALNTLPLEPIISKKEKENIPVDLFEATQIAVSRHMDQIQTHFDSVYDQEFISEENDLDGFEYYFTSKPEPKLKPTDRVYIDWSIPSNANHYNASLFKKWTDRKIRKLYEDNLKAKNLQNKNKLQTQGSFHSFKEFDPLIYTISHGNLKRQVSLATHVNHHRKILKNSLAGFFARQKGKRAIKRLKKNRPFSGGLSPLKGQLPSFVKSTSIHTSDRTKHEETGIGITLAEKAANVTIDIRTHEGVLIKNITNSPLDAGSHDFIWKHAEEASGTYQLDIIVNGQKVSQLRTIKTKRKKKRKSPHQGDATSCRDLLHAVKSEDIKLVNTLIKKINPNCAYYDDGEARSSLVAAARIGNVVIGKLLLDHGAKTSYHADGDESPLMAAANNDHLGFVQLLLSAGAEVNQKIIGDGTALICALKNGHFEISKLLLENGADPILGSRGDENPIYHASKQKDKKFLDLVLAYSGKK